VRDLEGAVADALALGPDPGHLARAVNCYLRPIFEILYTRRKRW
jgi:phosphate starvation-inducible protein PhoH